jgi:hypothetical protein
MRVGERRVDCSASSTVMVKNLLVIALALASAREARATEAGIDAGWVVADGDVVDRLPAIDSLGVRWVRINFRLDAWSAPDDTTPRGSEGLTWFAAYDRVIDSFIARGYQVYGLINDEAVASTHPHGSDAWIADYVANATAIVGHFKDRIRHYEIINEPNDWAGGSSSRFSPREFAKILQDTYLEVKHHASHIDDRCWQVNLVSGALFSFDDNSSAQYLSDVYAIGKSELAWDWTHEATGSYPLDGVGYHMYVAQGSDSPVDSVRSAMQANLDEMRNVVVGYEGIAKPFYVSEWGFRADAVGEQGQADRMAEGFGAMADHGDVALGLYFALQDFPDNPWGVYDESMNRRPVADRLAQVGESLRPPDAAAIVDVSAATMAPGEVGDVAVTLENRGTVTWTDEFRLGAATGCPDAAAMNTVAWEPSNGYANSIGDARVFLAQPVAPGETVTVHVPVRAPSEPGSYVFAARMVHENVAWFGATTQIAIDVRAPAVLADEAANGCSSSRTNGSLWPLLVALVLLRFARPR